MTTSFVEGRGRFTGRPVVMGTHGVVSSGHPIASQVGLRVLMDGGNVVDSAVATSAVLGVLRPHMTGLGGDLFCLIHLAREGRVVAVNSSGPAPRAASIAAFRQRGLQRIPTKGPLAVAVPGCIAGWEMALERFGTMRMDDVLAYAVGYAEDGFPVSPHLAGALAEGATHFADLPSWSATYLPENHLPRRGERLKLPGLARTLRAIQEGGADAFYEGPIAEAIGRHMEREGGLLARGDLAGFRGELLEPLRIDYRGYTVYEQPPVSQGHLLLQQLAIAEGFDLRSLGPESPRAIHLMVESKKLAFADRLRYLGDPTFVQVPLKQLLSREYASTRRKDIDPKRAILAAAPGAFAANGRDTTHHCVMDTAGNCVTMIQSIFFSFGSGVVVPDTGIALNNRLSCFFLDPAHPNALSPGKRSVHTLNSYMLFRDGRPLIAGGTPGADDQVQVSFQVICNLIDHGMNVQEAIDAPRWSSAPGTMPGETTNAYELRLEDRFPADVAPSLEEMGHDVRTAPPWSFGSASIVMMDLENGVLLAGSDPRRDGYAVGW